MDAFTLTAIPIEQFVNDNFLGHGTGFVWSRGEQFYLVTSWHVLSMCDFFTRAHLRKDGGRPNKLRALFNIRTGSFDRQWWEIKIRDDDDRPLWLVFAGFFLAVAVFLRVVALVTRDFLRFALVLPLAFFLVGI